MGYSLENIVKIVESTPELEKIEVKLLNENSPFMELGFDSLEMSSLLFEIEQRFQIEISDDEIPDLNNIKALLDRMNKGVSS